jgi:hypothetical protein
VLDDTGRTETSPVSPSTWSTERKPTERNEGTRDNGSHFMRKPPTERIFFPVLTRSGPQIDIEVLIRNETVEIWRQGACKAIFDRGHLRAWMADPVDPIGMGDVTFTLDRYVDLEGRVAITMPDVMAWTLSHHTATQLRNRL